MKMGLTSERGLDTTILGAVMLCDSAFEFEKIWLETLESELMLAARSKSIDSAPSLVTQGSEMTS